MNFIKHTILNILLLLLIGCGSSSKEEVSHSRVKGIQEINIKKDIGAGILISTVSASSLSKHRNNLGLPPNNSIEIAAIKASRLIRQAVVWKNENNLWQPGQRKNRQDYKYAGKIDGIYQYIQKDDIECREQSSLEHCNLKESIVDGIGMDVSHYLSKWPIFFLAMKQASKTTEEASYYQKIIEGTIKQVEENVIQYENGKYLLTNYMDGTNGIYRWNYVYRGKNWGYNPYELSYAYLFSILGYLNKNDNKLRKSYTHILENMNRYKRIEPNSKTELLVRLSLKNSENNPTLNCININQYTGCEERYTFDKRIRPELERAFTGSNANETTSYYFIVGQHHTVMQYAFEHNIEEWKQAYYQHFSRFVAEVVDSNNQWVNLNDYYESHYILWASIFLQLSSQYDKENYSNYHSYDKETEEKLRIFLEDYIIKLYSQYKDF